MEKRIGAARGRQRLSIYLVEKVNEMLDLNLDVTDVMERHGQLTLEAGGYSFVPAPTLNGYDAEIKAMFMCPVTGCRIREWRLVHSASDLAKLKAAHQEIHDAVRKAEAVTA